MRFKNIRRVGVVAWPVAAGALILASCGSDAAGTAATASTINLDTEATSYIVKDPVTTTIAPLIVEESGISSTSQTYVVQSGDYPLKVAADFGIELDDLINFNGWASADEFPFPGSEILIPANAKIPSATPDVVDAAADTPVGETIPDSGSNCAAGKHTVAAGDYPLALSKQYDVTIESLDAANAGNPAYSQFVPGQEIIIPAKATC